MIGPQGTPNPPLNAGDETRVERLALAKALHASSSWSSPYGRWRKWEDLGPGGQSVWLHQADEVISVLKGRER